MKKINLDIEGMHCSSCAMNIDFDLEDLTGVKTAKTNYAKQKCEVEFKEDEVTIEGILKQINNTGYKAKLIQ
ncbi:MAG: heavy metal-associated domain-containing protein [Patescibacteria group bacterium]